MNRTEQASEPTMEEILASIRLIISDDAKVASPPEREEQPRRLVTQKAALQPVHEQNEDVLDLAESLDAAPIQAAAPMAREERKVVPVVSLRQPKPTEDLPPEPDLTEQQEAPDEIVPPHLEEMRQSSSATNQALSQAAPSVSRTMWSRREIPAPVPSTLPLPAQYEAQAHPQKRWHHDVQMPIPEHGPVSLIMGQDNSSSAEAEDAATSDGAAIAQSPTHPAQDQNQTTDAAITAFAEKLARSTAEAKPANDLAPASAVDVSSLGKDRKADIAEPFANVMPSDAREYPKLLDDVFRHDYRRAPLAEEKGRPADDTSELEASPLYDDHPIPVEGLNGSTHPLETSQGAQTANAAQILAEHLDTLSYAQEASQDGQPSAPKQDEKAPRIAETAISQELPADPEPVKLAPPSLETVSPPVPEVRTGSPLEEAVRDLLRPLLVQWLDENMPRVLENAIRDEIAAHGLLSKPGK